MHHDFFSQLGIDCDTQSEGTNYAKSRKQKEEEREKMLISFSAQNINKSCALKRSI